MNKFLERRLVNVLNAAITLVSSGILALPARKQVSMTAKLLDGFSRVCPAQTPLGEILFYCPNKLTLSRAESLLEKEPETIEWIDGFAQGEALWDIGANVGCYTLYAAKRGIAVRAFEPSASNYIILNKNIALNGLSGTAEAYCLALSNETRLGTLNMTSLEEGGALNEFGDALDSVHFVGEDRAVRLRQGMVGFSMDDFIRVNCLEAPNHIKIDVDGIEDKVIAGAKDTLRNPRVKSILIELDTEHDGYYESVTGAIMEAGFELAARRHAERYDTGRFKAVYNHIFKRA